MTYELNDTHDASLKCRVEAARDRGIDFPIQNLPYGVFALLQTGRTEESIFRLKCFFVRNRCAGQALEPALLRRSNLKDLYWTPAQLLTHHAGNGCNLRPGDLLASGTVSGPAREARGCPLELPGGETRRFLEDGDEVVFRGRAERPGFAAIGLGECRGTIGGL